MTTDAWGVDDQYEDALGTHRVTSAESRAAIHRAMGVDPQAEPQTPPVWVVKQAASNRLAGRGEIHWETGGSTAFDGLLPPDACR